MSRTACILSLTPVTDEPRVRRQAEALHKAGWKVVVCGLPGRSAAPGFWQFVEVPPPRWHSLQFLLPAFFMLLARFSGAAARAAYWRHVPFAHFWKHVKPALATPPNIILAHDYYTVPMAAALGEYFSCPFSIDAHEYAKTQRKHVFWWRLLVAPWVDQLQRHYLPKAAFVTTVCDGIADLLAKDYTIARPTVVRSTPSYRAMQFRPTGETIRVLYSGIIDPVRGLELAIRSLPLCRSEFEFIIRGPGHDSGYAQWLQALARELGVADRVSFEPPVVFEQIVPAANATDIGYFVHADLSPQKRFTLPNKFFEYIMAGLALCVSDLPEMARLTRQYNLGNLARGFDTKAVADAINSFTREQIDACKKRSLEAAKTLCWEQESAAMLVGYERALSGH